MDTEVFGALRRALAVARKANKDADEFEKQGWIDSAEIADAYAYGIHRALRAALYKEEA